MNMRFVWKISRIITAMKLVFFHLLSFTTAKITELLRKVDLVGGVCLLRDSAVAQSVPVCEGYTAVLTIIFNNSTAESLVSVIWDTCNLTG